MWGCFFYRRRVRIPRRVGPLVARLQNTFMYVWGCFLFKQRVRIPIYPPCSTAGVPLRSRVESLVAHLAQNTFIWRCFFFQRDKSYWLHWNNRPKGLTPNNCFRSADLIVHSSVRLIGSRRRFHYFWRSQSNNRMARYPFSQLSGRQPFVLLHYPTRTRFGSRIWSKQLGWWDFL